MAEIILDIGSGKSLHLVSRAEEMIDKVANMDSHKHTIIFKAQLFKSAPPNNPLSHDVFTHLYYHAAGLGYEMTASVFDKESLAFLSQYHIPFVKIACRPDLYWLVGEVPRKIPVYLSYDGAISVWDHIPGLDGYGQNIKYMVCVPEYPADIVRYMEMFTDKEIKRVSDHTVGWELFRRADPIIIEKHLCPSRDVGNPDAGPFAVTPEELREVIA